MKVTCTDRSAQLRVTSAAHTGMDFHFSGCVMRREANDGHPRFSRVSRRHESCDPNTAVRYLHTKIDRRRFEPTLQQSGGTERSWRSIYSEPAAYRLDRHCRPLR